MRPLDFYDLGMRIASRATEEAEHRTVINRVYYGLHHESCCRYFRKELSPQPLNRNSRHTDLRRRFNRPEDPIAGNVSRLIGSLMRLRGEADYQLSNLRYRNRSYTPEQLMLQAVAVAKELLGALELYSPGEAGDGCPCPETYSVS
jgi:hypothetical protein